MPATPSPVPASVIRPETLIVTPSNVLTFGAPALATPVLASPSAAATTMASPTTRPGRAAPDNRIDIASPTSVEGGHFDAGSPAPAAQAEHAKSDGLAKAPTDHRRLVPS